MNTLRDILAIPFLVVYAISALIFAVFAYLAVSIGGVNTAKWLAESNKSWLK